MILTFPCYNYYGDDMETNNTYQQFLQQEHDSSKILEVVYSLDRQLKYLHSKNYYVTDINFKNVVMNDNNDFGFVYIDKIPTGVNKEFYINSNINSMVNFSLGSYVFLASYDAGYVSSIESFDYTQITKQYPDFIKEHYDFIRTTIPASDEFAEYYDNAINGEFGYFSDLVDRKSKESQANKNSALTMVKTTQVGKALSNDDDAFVGVLFYPIIGICISILSIVIYLILLYR